MGLFDMGMNAGDAGGGFDLAKLQELIMGKQTPAPGVDTAMGVMGAPPMDPNMTSPISPENLAKNAAARGIPPPPVDLAPAAANGSVGAALTGNTVPVPQPRPAAAGAPGAPMDIRPPAQVAGEAAGAGAQPQQRGGLAEALKGVKMPAGPELQKLGTPAAPRVSTAIKGGDLQALLMALNASPGASEYKLPSTLGAAIRK